MRTTCTCSSIAPSTCCAWWLTRTVGSSAAQAVRHMVSTSRQAGRCCLEVPTRCLLVNHKRHTCGLVDAAVGDVSHRPVTQPAEGLSFASQVLEGDVLLQHNGEHCRGRTGDQVMLCYHIHRIWTHTGRDLGPSHRQAGIGSLLD